MNKKLLLLITYLLVPLQCIGMELLVPYLTPKNPIQKQEIPDNINEFNNEFNNEDPFLIKRDYIISTAHIWLYAPRPHNSTLFAQIKSALPINSILKNFEKFGISLWILEDKQTKEIFGYNGIEISKKTYEWKYALLKKHCHLDYITETTPFIFNKFFNIYQQAIISTLIEPSDTGKIDLAKKLGMHNKTTQKYRQQNKLYFTLSYLQWSKNNIS